MKPNEVEITKLIVLCEVNNQLALFTPEKKNEF
jgi:hypothetical protein